MAGRFRFRLEVVQRLRQVARDQQRRALAEAIAAVQTSENHVDDLNRSLRDSLMHASTQQQGESLDLSALRAEQRHRAWLHEQLHLAGERVVQSHAELQRQRELLAEATKNLRVIEKLRERRWRRHLEEVQREEQAADDEAAASVVLRRVQWESRSRS